MIRLRLCDMGDYSSISGHRRIAKWYERERDFLDILNGNIWEEEKYPPFRDAESAGLIHAIDKAEFVEGDWYSMVTQYGRTCLSALCSGAKYGLTVISNSKKGFYTDITGDAGAGDNVWEYLAGLEMDILLAYPYKEFLKDGIFPLYLPRPFIVENFRYQGEVLEAVVTTEKAQSLPEYRNGKLHVDPWMCELAYDWTKDVDGICAWLEKNMEKTLILQQPEQVLTLEEFWDNIHGDEKGDYYKSDLLEQREAYWESAKIHNHMSVKPKETFLRDVPMLLVEKRDNGYHLKTKMITRYPTYEEMFYDAVTDLPEDLEWRYALVLDTYAMECAECLKEALCGIKLCGDRIDTYDKKDALREFLCVISEVTAKKSAEN